MKGSYLALMLGAAVCMLAPARALAQTFEKYQCDDGAEFIMTIYTSRRTAFVQLDGRRLTLTQDADAADHRRARPQALFQERNLHLHQGRHRHPAAIGQARRLQAGAELLTLVET
jgi:hypothetical protein